MSGKSNLPATVARLDLWRQNSQVRERIAKCIAIRTPASPPKGITLSPQ
jgi:hypothetical protein